MTTITEGEVARGELVVLREKRLGDAPDDYRWRCQPELTRFDAARPIAATYNDFLALYREEILYPSPYRRSLAIEDAGRRHIGNLMYYNIDTLRSEAELGITIGEPEYWGRGYGTDAVRLVVEYLLGRLGFRRIHLKTLSWNKRARHCFENAGFVECGRANRAGQTFVLMEHRQEWLRPLEGATMEEAQEAL